MRVVLEWCGEPDRLCAAVAPAHARRRAATSQEWSTGAGGCCKVVSVAVAAGDAPRARSAVWSHRRHSDAGGGRVASGKSSRGGISAAIRAGSSPSARPHDWARPMWGATCRPPSSNMIRPPCESYCASLAGLVSQRRWASQGLAQNGFLGTLGHRTPREGASASSSPRSCVTWSRHPCCTPGRRTSTRGLGFAKPPASAARGLLREAHRAGLAFRAGGP